MNVALGTVTKEELEEMSMVEIAYHILDEKNQPVSFQKLVEEIANLLQLSDEEARGRMARFYTDLNIDGRFMNVGGNTWGLKSWYPVQQIEDEIVPSVKMKKKKAKAGYDYEEDCEEEDLEYDEDMDEEDEYADEGEDEYEENEDLEYEEDEYAGDEDDYIEGFDDDLGDGLDDEDFDDLLEDEEEEE